jgi:osmotically-inducible protein OsmY
MPGPAGLGKSAAVPDRSDVKAEAQDNIITLTGHVRTWAGHDAVISAAWTQNGLIDVRDELHVTG